MNKELVTNHQRSRGFWALVGFIGAGLILLAYLSGSQWGVAAQIAAVIYAVLVTLFLVAQLLAFVGVQVTYLKSVEAQKFQVLDIEGIECGRRPTGDKL